MARILGVEIPNEKRIVISLTSIYGIGLTTSKRILESAGINPDLRAGELTTEQINLIINAINDESDTPIEGDLRRKIQSDLKRLASINCYRAIRHRNGMPVRGQRTSTNARTRKGKKRTIGVERNPNAKKGKV